jgi:protein-disulfide isomerase
MLNLSRRLILGGGAALWAGSAWADGPGSTEPDSFYSPRSIGRPDAPVKIIECFSLTCTHCAAFSNTTMLPVLKNLVSTGKLQITYNDFPLDAVALMAAVVARTLPYERYYPFIATLFEQQDEWAFKPGVDFKAALFRYASFAGMDRETYDAVIADPKRAAFVMQERHTAETEFGVNSTPSFILDGKTHAGVMEYDAFAKLVGLG